MSDDSITIRIGHDVVVTPIEDNQPTHEEPKPKMTPSIGRIVHYSIAHSFDPDSPVYSRPAIITDVNRDGTVALMVFGIQECSPRYNVPYDENCAPNTWRFIPFEMIP